MRLLHKHERYLDAFQRFQFLTSRHLQSLFGSNLNARTLRFDLLKLMTAGYLRRSRTNRDEEYTYFTSDIREKSPLLLEHTNEITWAQILLAEASSKHGIEVLVLERRQQRIRFSATVPNKEGIMKSRGCVPDFFSAHRRAVKTAADPARCFFWEITNAKPGQHWEKENDIIQKCRIYNAYFESGEFFDRLHKEFHVEVRNFRVVITFPTEARARNFVGFLRAKAVAYPGRFWVTWRDAYHEDMYGRILVCAKDDTLHSLTDGI
ncbi:MAG: hypothetical protein C5B51_14760 [Terriglobia bacterium]|nr:MAG: hypothetical protein C5B51_14760 [Terriglobia bacterium]